MGLIGTLIALRGRGNVGKTATILHACDLLLEQYPDAIIIQRHYVGRDIHLIVEIKGRIIVLMSRGDPGTALGIRLEACAKLRAVVIVCACRTYGMTFDQVRSLGDRYGLRWRNQPIAPPAAREASNLAMAKQLVAEIGQVIERAIAA